MSEWLTTEQVAERLSLSTKSIRTMVADGTIPAYRLGRRQLRFRADEVDNALRRVPTTTRGGECE